MSDFPSTADELGVAPEVSDSLAVSEETRYAVRDEGQAVSICEKLREDTEPIIKNVAVITNFLNGQRPNNPQALKEAGRSWYPNTSSRFLKNQCSAIPARIFMPILTATSLTGAELEPGWPNGSAKSSTFRDKVTRTIRSWVGNVWFWKQISTEAGYFGFGYAVNFDEWEWRPTFVRCTRGFVPIGTQISDEDGPPMFAVAYDYRVDQLLEIVERAKRGGRTEDWNEANVAAAINAAAPKAEDTSEHNAREYAEMVRDATIGESYEKAYRLVNTWHLFSTDPDGTVSHHIVLATEAGSKKPEGSRATEQKNRLLFERRGQFASMNDVVNPFLFDPETGTIHGSWGAAQHIFDIAQEFEKRANDWAARQILNSRVMLLADKGVNPDEVKMMVNDLFGIVTNAEFRGNMAAIPTDAKPFMDLLEFYRQQAGEIIGNYIPPIPLTTSDIKSAHIDAKVKEQQERKEQTFLLLLHQIAKIVRSMVRRLTKDGSPDPEAKRLVDELLKAGLTREEIRLLADQPPIHSIFDFTTFAIEKRAAFAAAKQGNPFYNQAQLERVQAEAVGGRGFAETVLLPGDDATTERMARRVQQLETVAMQAGEVIEVLPIDSDFAHMQELRPKLEQAVMDMHPSAMIMLQHFTAHWLGATNKKGFPKGYSGNLEKAFIQKAAVAIQTGQLPPEGLADRTDLISEVEQQISQEPVLSGPSDEEPTGASSANAAGLMRLVEGSAN